MIILDNQSALLYAHNKARILEAFVAPLRQYLGITHFGYKRYYTRTKRYIFLSTHHEWMTHHLQNVTSHGVFFSEAMHMIQGDQLHCVTWPEEPSDDFLKRLLNHDMWHGINFYQRHKEYTELWTFSTHPEYAQFRFWRVDLQNDLRKFIAHFSFEMQDLLENIPVDAYAYLPFEKENEISPTHHLNAQLEEFRESFGYMPFLYVGSQSYSLTKREAQCVQALSQGRSMKEMARLFSLSPRTVEGYINKVKEKTGLVSKTTLISCYLETESRFSGVFIRSVGAK